MKDLVKKWFYYTIGILLCLIIVYVISHFYYKGAAVSILSNDEIVNVNSIVNGANLKTPKTPDQNASSNAAATTGTTGTSTVPDTDLTRARKAVALSYIFSTRHLSSTKDSSNIVTHFKSLDLQQFTMVVSKYPFKVRSYFWLTDDAVYLEIVFWSLFGLIASLLYNVSEALRTEDFDLDEVAVHIAKFFYAPFCALIIYFSFNLISSKGDASLNQISNGTIVLAFILGFFSGRTIELLNKIKELILPSDTDNPSSANSYFVNGSLVTVPPVTPSSAISTANVKIQSNTTSSFKKTVNPDTNGLFSFTNLPADTYSITVTLQNDSNSYTGQDDNFQLNPGNPSHKSAITLT
jgi:hypothetical protein